MTITSRRLVVASDYTAAPKRVRPRRGCLLSMDCVRGDWRPTGAVAGAGVFGVIWTTGGGSWWAPLHDFTQGAQQHLIGECRRLDVEAFGGHP